MPHICIGMSHIWMSHVTHMNESCHKISVTPHIYIVMSYMWMSHATHMHRYVTRMNESCHTYTWVMSHAWMRHYLQREGSKECVWVISRMLMSHITHTHSHTYECIMSHTCHVTRIIEYNYHTYNYLMDIGVASVSKISKTIGFFCKRAL